MKSLPLLRFALGTLLLAAMPARVSAAEASSGDSRRDLLDLLVQKGVLTSTEAKELTEPAPPAATGLVFPGTKSVTKLSLSGRVQAQFAAISAEQDAGADPASNQHFLIRRVYLTAKAELGPDWRALMTYNFANSLFDVAVIQWGRSDALTVDVGYRMVNLGREQRTGSGALKAIERSGATRYFVESNNGTRLGAGSYRVGVFADGKQGNAFWGVAVTNPEQPTSTAQAAAAGGGGNNRPAIWLNGGHTRKTDSCTLVLGTGLGWLPDQGGLTVGTGDDLLVGTVYADYTRGRLHLLAEGFGAEVAGGAASGADARVLGAFLQPAWRFTQKLEGVTRIGYLDTDGRGVRLADAVPGSPATLPVDRLWDAYLGATWYFKGNDLKLQAGLIYARGEDTPAGLSNTLESYGVRSQMQVNF